ncbi:MAG: hypothetical protein KJ043_11390, partial [Anaerolineae bacterium]|nr:hypothetical protein [Anaerolineae bacterium]
WEKKQAEERAKKEAKKASSTPAPTPVASTPPPPPAPEPEPTPQPVASSSSVDETPDFDSMTPEQMMAWMEALAVRQGANLEEMTTDESSRPQVKEIDPTTVDIKDNYIPYGMSAEQWEKKQADERAKKEAQKSSKPQGKTPFTPPPPVDMPVLEDSPTQPAPVLDLGGGDSGGADWLSDLASGTTAELPNEFPEFDLSNLGDNLQEFDLPNFDNLENLQLEGLGDLAGLADGNTDPIDWLNNLVNEGDNQPVPTLENPFDSLFDEKPTTPVADNSIEWLESLAKKQGVSDDELITRPQVEFDLPELELDPNYVESDSNPFDFDNVDNLDQAAMDATDPVAWLDSLAESQNLKTTAQSAPDEITTEDMLQKLNKGISDPNDVTGWMDKLLEEGAKRQVPDYISEDEEPLQANIPDWLIDQVGLPPEMGGATNETPIEIDFDSLIPTEALPTDDMPDWLGEDLGTSEQPEAVAGDMPDWLTDTLSEQSDSVQAIFESQPSGSSPLTTEEIEVDMSDPWVEAFELERQVAMGLISDEEVIFSDEPISLEEVLEDILEDEPLPLGELENVPSWMDTSAPAMPVQVATASSDDNLPDWLRETEDEALIVADEPLPDWLSEAGIADTSDVPDWLLETVGEEEPVQVFTPPAPTPAPVPTPQPPVVKQSPAPVPTGNINVVEVLQQARAKIQAGEVDNGLVGYEAIIRANTALDSVIGDLQALVKQEGYKTNASVYRVLGDGLMRQGQLQQALDIYRKALNLL